MCDIEFIEQKLNDFENTILSIDKGSFDIKTEYETIALEIYKFIKNNNLLNNEYENRINYDMTINRNIFELKKSLKEYSINFWIKRFKDQVVDYNAFLESTFSNYKYLIPPYIDRYDYKKFNPNNNVFVPNSYSEFIKVLKADELWNLYDIEDCSFKPSEWHLYSFIDFAQIPIDEYRLLGLEVTQKDEENAENLKKYRYLTIKRPKELKLREFCLFDNLVYNHKEVFQCYFKLNMNYYDGIAKDDIRNCFLSIVQELKYFLINEKRKYIAQIEVADNFYEITAKYREQLPRLVEIIEYIKENPMCKAADIAEYFTTSTKTIRSQFNEICTKIYKIDDTKEKGLERVKRLIFK